MAAKKTDRPITKKTAVQKLDLSSNLLYALLRRELRTIGAIQKALRDPNRSTELRGIIESHASSTAEAQLILELGKEASRSTRPPRLQAATS